MSVITVHGIKGTELRAGDRGRGRGDTDRDADETQWKPRQKQDRGKRWGRGKKEQVKDSVGVNGYQQVTGQVKNAK